MNSSKLRHELKNQKWHGLRLLFLMSLLLAAYAVLSMHQGCSDAAIEHTSVDIKCPGYGEVLAYVNSKVPPDVLAGFDSGFVIQIDESEMLSEFLLDQPLHVNIDRDFLSDCGLKAYLSLEQLLSLLEDDGIVWISPVGEKQPQSGESRPRSGRRNL